MSLLGEVEAVAGVAAPELTWLRIAFKVAPYVVIAGLIVALVMTRGTLREARMQAQVDAAQAQTAAAKIELGFAQAQTDAVKAFADKLGTQQPIIVHATDTVREYANTPAGRAQCASADLVHGTDLLDQQLFPASPAGNGH